MATKLTLAEARSQLTEFVVPPQGSAESQADRFLRYLNQVADRLLQKMQVKGIFERVIFPQQTTGILTLPPPYENIVGMTMSESPVPLFDQFLEFIENGPGHIDEALGGLLPTDLGGQFCTTRDIDAAAVGTLVLTYAGSDTVTGRLYGVNSATGLPVVDAVGAIGENFSITSATSPVTTAASFSSLTGIVKIRSFLPLAIARGATTLVTLQTWETNPSYRRYKVGSADMTIRTLCRRTHVPIVANTDPVYPHNLGALKQALLALNYEDYNDDIRADEYWDKSYELLGIELKAARGMVRPSFRFQPYGWGNRNIPRVN